EERGRERRRERRRSERRKRGGRKRRKDSQDKPISVIQVAPPFSHDQSVNAWFTDASAKRKGK
ncbi:unnamed protein product, partial [Bubo scandiacus]